MKIVIADDHPLFRDGIRNLIRTTDDLVIVGEAGSGEEAVSMAAALRPDLILMDIRMPDMNGVEATRTILERDPGIRILILSMHKDDKTVFTAMKAGARGYMLKEADGAELLQSIRMVGGGSAVFSSDIASRIIGFFGDRSEPPNPYYEQLTGREKEVLRRIAEGDSNAEIALRFHISAKTVANNVTNILNKLQVADRNEARQLIRAYEELPE